MKPSEPLRDVLRPAPAKPAIEKPRQTKVTVQRWMGDSWFDISFSIFNTLDEATRYAQDYVWATEDHNADYMIWFYDEDSKSWSAEYEKQLKFTIEYIDYYVTE